jgi:hypothetical protein
MTNIRVITAIESEIALPARNVASLRDCDTAFVLPAAPAQTVPNPHSITYKRCFP